MKYKHLFFDLDHTLWDFEANAKETLQELYELNSLAERGVDSFERFFEQYSFHNTRLWDKYTKGEIRHEELKWKRMWLSLLDFKIADEALSKTMAVQFLERLPLKKNLFPYTVEILTYLKNKGYQLHLITNGFDVTQRSKLQTADLESFFVEVITSEASQALKPSKEIFDYAVNKCGASCTESVMIGDNLDADIQGGINAGMDTIFVNHLNVEPHIKPTYVIHHLRELEDIL
ncbi:MAG TPA: YjjG family noncanonical pyrimidine nucleotidase [Chitinophagaceae bacterium]